MLVEAEIFKLIPVQFVEANKTSRVQAHRFFFLKCTKTSSRLFRVRFIPLISLTDDANLHLTNCCRGLEQEDNESLRCSGWVRELMPCEERVEAVFLVKVGGLFVWFNVGLLSRIRII